MKIGWIAYLDDRNFAEGRGEFFKVEPPEWYYKVIQIAYSEIEQ